MAGGCGLVIKKKYKNMEDTNEIFLKSLSQMERRFSSTQYLKACRENGLSAERVGLREHLTFLRGICEREGERHYFKPSKLPMVSVATSQSAFSFESAKRVVEEHGYVVCKKEVRLTPL